MDEHQADQARHRREDPRPAQTRELVLQAARMIVASEGHAAVTPTRLVELSGVARSTIYRHWPDASAIVVDATTTDNNGSSHMTPSGDRGADLRSYLNELRDMLESPGAAIVIAQADIAERDEKAAETLGANARHRNKLISELLEDPRSNFDSTHIQLVGPLFMQRFFVRQPITDQQIDDIVESYLANRPHD